MAGGGRMQETGQKTPLSPRHNRKVTPAGRGVGKQRVRKRSNPATAGRWRQGSEYMLPSRVGRARPRPLGIGVSAVVVMGLAAVALAGFVLMASLFDPKPGPVVGVSGTSTDSASSTQDGRHRDVLAANPLYLSGELGSVTCPAPETDPHDPASMENFLHEVTDCLDEAWGGHLTEAGLEFEPPNRVYWYTSGQSPCGTYPLEGTSAFYCHANKGLYLGVEDIVTNSASSDRTAAYAFLLGHEYSHHVQGEAGILTQHPDTQNGAGSSRRDEWSRRSELQANCLSGVFLGAVESSFPIEEAQREEILRDAELRADRDDEHTHGNDANSRMWTEHGMDRRDPAACNTWEAEEELVD